MSRTVVRGVDGSADAALLGSVSSELVGVSRCPVLVVPAAR